MSVSTENLGWCVTSGITQRQLLQRREPPFGFTSRLRRETRLQRWIHRNALAPLQNLKRTHQIKYQLEL
jgi:hypothetical protein